MHPRWSVVNTFDQYSESTLDRPSIDPQSTTNQYSIETLPVILQEMFTLVLI